MLLRRWVLIVATTLLVVCIATLQIAPLFLGADAASAETNVHGFSRWNDRAARTLLTIAKPVSQLSSSMSSTMLLLCATVAALSTTVLLKDVSQHLL